MEGCSGHSEIAGNVRSNEGAMNVNNTDPMCAAMSTRAPVAELVGESQHVLGRPFEPAQCGDDKCVTLDHRFERPAVAAAFACSEACLIQARSSHL